MSNAGNDSGAGKGSKKRDAMLSANDASPGKFIKEVSPIVNPYRSPIASPGGDSLQQVLQFSLLIAGFS